MPSCTLPSGKLLLLMYLAFIVFVLPAEELPILHIYTHTHTHPFLSDGKELQHVQQALPILSEAGGAVT